MAIRMFCLCKMVFQYGRQCLLCLLVFVTVLSYLPFGLQYTLMILVNNIMIFWVPMLYLCWRYLIYSSFRFSMEDLIKSMRVRT